LEKDLPARPPKDTSHVVLDSAAGVHGKALERLLKQVRRVIVPVQPSLFDILATSHFLETLLEEKAVRKERTFVAVVGMRVDARTRAAGELERFLASYDLPVLSFLRDTQLYVQLVANGMTLFDLSPARAEKDIEQWKPIIDWVEAD
jgi:chromosome partitioning protein